ncbi:MAG TPA: RNA-binding protein [Lactobacillus sp.]|nr:RNA-binding protein [Lactobacillus sp.]
MSLNADELWQQFIAAHPKAANAPHRSWSFGGGSETADIEAMKVVAGLKQATTTLAALYEYDKQPVPTTHDGYEILYDGSVHAVAILQYVAVQQMPFDQVTAEHAYFEGLDDRQLTTWRTTQRARFTAQAKAINTTFTDQSTVVALTFKVVFLP